MPTFDYEAEVDQILSTIDTSEAIHPDNKEWLRAWCRDMRLDSLSQATVQKRMAHMRVVTEHLGETRFVEVEKAEMKDLVEWVQSRDIADSTQEGYKKILRFFWRWLYEQEDIDWMAEKDYPAVVDWISPNYHASNDTLPQDLLTKDDVEEQIDAAYNPRDKAFISLLYETGARIGELIDLTVGDIEDREHGRKIVIDGKTGPRRLPLKESVPYLNNWLNVHPTGEADNPLWCKLQSPEQLSYNYIRQKILQKTADQAEIEKPVNPHHYRHSRATELANEFTEAQLCEWFGWVQGSDIPAKYVHTSGRDIDNAYDALYGEASSSESTTESSTRECPRCDELNRAGAKWCDQCGMDLTREQAEPEPTDPMDRMVAIVEDHPETAQTLVDSVLHAVADSYLPEADGEDPPLPAVRERIQELGDAESE